MPWNIKEFVLLLIIIQLSPIEMVDMIGGREVKVFTKAENWIRAHEICAANGMEMLINYNLEENNQSIALAQKNGFLNYWLGGKRLDGTWTWVSTGKPLIYLPWGKGQPDNAGGNVRCLMRYQLYKLDPVSWNDAPCEFRYPIICQEMESVISRTKLEQQLITANADKKDLETKLGETIQRNDRLKMDLEQRNDEIIECQVTTNSTQKELVQREIEIETLGEEKSMLEHEVMNLTVSHKKCLDDIANIQRKLTVTDLFKIVWTMRC